MEKFLSGVSKVSIDRIETDFSGLEEPLYRILERAVKLGDPSKAIDEAVKMAKELVKMGFIEAELERKEGL